MSDSTLAYAVHTANWQGVTRDLPHGPEDLQWVANSATLIYGDQDAVLVDTYTSIEQNAELVQWVRSFGKRLTYIYITHGHGDHFFGIGQLQEAGSVPVRRAVPVLVDEVIGGDHPASHAEPRPFPLPGGWGGWSGLSRWSRQIGQRPPCPVSRRRLYLSSGGLTRCRRVAQ